MMLQCVYFPVKDQAHAAGLIHFLHHLAGLHFVHTTPCEGELEDILKLYNEDTSLPRVLAEKL